MHSHQRNLHRRSIRMPAYDYTQPGAYFITVCTHRRQPLLANPQWRQIIQQEWNRIPSLRPGVALDEFIIMPNHIHGILILDDMGVCNTPLPPAPLTSMPTNGPIRSFRSPSCSLGSILRGFKAAITSRARQSGFPSHHSFWQHNYYERVLRDDPELDRARQYIRDNPLNWPFDPDNPRRTPNPKYDKLWSFLHPL